MRLVNSQIGSFLLRRYLPIKHFFLDAKLMARLRRSAIILDSSGTPTRGLVSVERDDHGRYLRVIYTKRGVCHDEAFKLEIRPGSKFD